MNDYLLVIYNTETKELYNEVIKGHDRSCISHFQMILSPRKVIINVMEL